MRLPHIAIDRPTAVQAWVLNMRANADVRLRIRGADFDGVAREIADADERELARYWFETGIPIAIDLKEIRP